MQGTTEAVGLIRRSRIAQGFVAAALAGLSAAILAPNASAAFHETKIREVTGDHSNGDGAYIELQMYSAGQNQVVGHKITIWDFSGFQVPATPGPIHECTLAGANPTGADNQRTILIGDTNVAGADFTCATLGTYLDTGAPLMGVTQAGAVCFEAIPVDCVSWGGAAFTGAPNLPDGTTPNGNTLPTGLLAFERKINPGCPTLLEAADDTNNAENDFTLVGANPEPNSTVPTEVPCPQPPATTGPTGRRAAALKRCAKIKNKKKKKKCKRRARRLPV